MTFPLRTQVLRPYKNEIWEGIVMGEFRTPEGRLMIVCESVDKEFKMFVSDPSHLRIKDNNNNEIVGR